MSSNKQLVSIIAVCYNHSRYVIDTLDSIINQTYKNLELIIMDDCSTDNSVELINEWIKKKKQSCTFISHTQNIGLCKTLNEALNLINGEYLQMISCDDILLPNKIETQVQFLLIHKEFSVVCSNYIEIDEKSNVLRESVFPDDFSLPDDIFSALLLGHKHYPILLHSTTAFYETKVFEEVGFYLEDIIQEDFYMWLKIAESFQIGYIPDCTVKYRELSSSLARNPKHGHRLTEDAFKVVKHFYDTNLQRRSECVVFQENKLEFCKTLVISGELSLEFFYHIINNYIDIDLKEKYKKDKEILNVLYKHYSKNSKETLLLMDEYGISKWNFFKQVLTMYFIKRRIKDFKKRIKNLIN